MPQLDLVISYSVYVNIIVLFISLWYLIVHFLLPLFFSREILEFFVNKYFGMSFFFYDVNYNLIFDNFFFYFLVCISEFFFIFLFKYFFFFGYMVKNNVLNFFVYR